jgi:2-dehydropantoate 2-reductase
LNPWANVSLIGHWPAQLAAIQQHGLFVDNGHGRQTNIKLHITNDPASLPATNLILVLVKSYQTAKAAQLAAKLIAADGLVMTLQNGLGNVETLTAVLSQSPVSSGITSAGAAIVAPGHLHVAGMGQTFLTLQPERIGLFEQIVALFQQAGFPTALTENADSLIWGKLAVNAGINPLTAILRKNNGYLTRNEAACHLMMRAANEVTAVAQAKGISLSAPNAGQQAFQVAQKTASNHSSMLQDIERGRPTEIEAICGAIVKHGRDNHIATPVNLAFYQCIKKIEKDDWEVAQEPQKAIDYLHALITSLEELS